MKKQLSLERWARGNDSINKQHLPDVVTAVEWEILLKKGVLGDAHPASLNYTVFYLCSQQFGTRGRQEHQQIRIEHLCSNRRDRIHRVA